MAFSVIGMVIVSIIIMLMGSCLLGLILSMIISDFDKFVLTLWIGAVIIGAIAFTKIFMA